MSVLDAYDALTRYVPVRGYHLSSASLKKIVAKKRLNRKELRHLRECSWCRTSLIELIHIDGGGDKWTFAKKQLMRNYVYAILRSRRIQLWKDI